MPPRLHVPLRSVTLILRRTLYRSSPLSLRQKPPPPPPPPDDYYSLLLTSPLPTASPSSKTPATHTLPSTPPQQNRNPKTARANHKPPPDPKIVFGSRLAGPAERRDKILRAAETAERPQEPDNCCMSGCVNCVWDVYREEVEEWASRRREREAKGALRVTAGSEGESGRKVGAGGGEGTAVGVLDGMEQGFDGVDLTDEGLFEGVPVGIREFMATEKRLKERRGEKG